MPKEETGFTPFKSRADPAKLAEFISAPINGDLLQIPGIGDATKKALIDAGIQNSFMLLGKYLSFKEDGIGPIEFHDRFYFWIIDIIPKTSIHKASVVHAIAEKMNILLPGIYDETYYQQEL